MRIFYRFLSDKYFKKKDVEIAWAIDNGSILDCKLKTDIIISVKWYHLFSEHHEI